MMRLMIALTVATCLPATTTVGGSTSPNRDSASPIEVAGFYLPEPLAMQPFELIDHNGRAFTDKNLRGQWTLLFFGYTSCQDVCPATLGQLRMTRSLLAGQAPALSTQAIIETLDPARDTPPQMKKYLAALGPGFVGVGGTRESLDTFALQFRVKYSASKNAPDVIDHTSSVALLTPDSELQVLFSAPLDPDGVARSVQQIARQQLRH